MRGRSGQLLLPPRMACWPTAATLDCLCARWCGSAATGAEQPLAAPARAYNNPRLSPDGQRVAVEIGAANLARTISRGIR